MLERIKRRFRQIVSALKFILNIDKKYNDLLIKQHNLEKNYSKLLREVNKTNDYDMLLREQCDKIQKTLADISLSSNIFEQKLEQRLESQLKSIQEIAQAYEIEQNDAFETQKVEMQKLVKGAEGRLVKLSSEQVLAFENHKQEAQKLVKGVEERLIKILSEQMTSLKGINVKTENKAREDKVVGNKILSAIERSRIASRKEAEIRYINFNRKLSTYLIQDSSLKGVTTLKRNPLLVVSLTTYPARIFDVSTAIKTLMCQSVKADRIVLWLARTDFPEGESALPQSLLELKELGLEIKWTDVDLGSYKKILPALSAFPEALNITADDDLLYPSDAIEQLYKSWEMFPKCISALRVHRMKFERNGSLVPYSQWSSQDSTFIKQPRLDLFATTGAGALFPPNALPAEVLRWDVIKDLCPQADDVWIKMMSLLNETPTVLVKHQSALEYVPGSQEGSTLWKFNKVDNDWQIQNVIQAYPVLNEKLKICAKEEFYGPALDDKYFFTECLNYQLPGMEEVKQHSMRGEFREARVSFANYIRNTLKPNIFFSLSYFNVEDNSREMVASAYKEKLTWQPLRLDRLEAINDHDFPLDWKNIETEPFELEQIHSHKQLKVLANEYMQRQEESIAFMAIDILKSWIRQVLFPSSKLKLITEKDGWTVKEVVARAGDNWLFALYAFFKSEAVSNDFLVDWFKSFWEHGNWLSKNTDQNSTITGMIGLAQIGILFPQFIQSQKWTEQAINNLEHELNNLYINGRLNDKYNIETFEKIALQIAKLFKTAYLIR